MVAAILIAATDVDAKIDFPARACSEAVLYRDKIAGHQCEQIAGFGGRIDPGDGPPAVAEVGYRAGIAVRQHHRTGADDRCGVTRHHIRAVGEEGDAAESLSLALGEIVAARNIQTAE